ncbi:hypothetical protein [Sporomusa acidovorans]|uniref:Uncharacterized protein n=1 Tax=Sporomusa acidovorans (strain ATCC 49682 / DSM 3132 / Mol) TaxID=1123286 RepID=A0ABZ3J8Y8_SPOA4|nr:hypothetical protein [Sporomusa acidovorans]OZC21283.1 hypothetical protein SPACI_21350 [Sporomusa acidovorans DSM 3132]SDE67005.1 hypothetical protein SAMN04488499_1018100 [Sporomusa acidovorans]
MKHHSRRKTTKRKYKQLMAALAGAALVSTALLPGLPISKAHAADQTVTASPAGETAAETATPGQDAQNQPDQNASPEKNQLPVNDQGSKPDKQPRHERERNTATSPIAALKAAAAKYGFDQNHDKFSLAWQSETDAMVIVQTENGTTFKVHLSLDNGTWTIDSVKRIVTGGYSDGVQAGDPVEVVKDNAATFGFDADNDYFTLLSITGGKAIVQVKTSGQTFKVDLERRAGSWIITTIRGIGNSVYPATYRPASLYGYPTLGAATGPVATINEQVLYTNNSFAAWSWRETTYPADMKLGVLFLKPQSADTAEIPGVIIDKLDTIDFGRQLALYAHIGSVAAKGYGIGIEKVVQTGNDLTVTVRLKSPWETDKLWPTKTNDVIPLDRLTLNFDNPIHIKFVDSNGSNLINYTIYNR